MRFQEYTIIAALLVAASVCFWRGLTPSDSPIQPVLKTTPVSLSTPQVVEQAIETIQVGQRVVGRIPHREEVEDWVPDAETWKKLELHMKKPSGASLWITLLRPNEWVENRGARIGSTVDLSLHELGAVGPAKVTAIHLCPEIQVGDGHPVVTGTFRHEVDLHSTVINLRLDGQSEPTGVTVNHHYWSVDRQEFVPAGELRVGETLDTHAGPTRVVSIEPRDHSRFVYNLETTEHVYRVGALATLVHNMSAQVSGTLDDFAASGEAAKKGGLTRTGHAFEKHAAGQRAGSSKFPKLSGNTSAKNAKGQEILDDILTDPGTVRTPVFRDNFAGGTRFTTPDGRQATFDANGVFQYFGE